MYISFTFFVVSKSCVSPKSPRAGRVWFPTCISFTFCLWFRNAALRQNRLAQAEFGFPCTFPLHFVCGFETLHFAKIASRRWPPGVPRSSPEFPGVPRSSPEKRPKTATGSYISACFYFFIVFIVFTARRMPCIVFFLNFQQKTMKIVAHKGFCVPPAFVRSGTETSAVLKCRCIYLLFFFFLFLMFLLFLFLLLLIFFCSCFFFFFLLFFVFFLN